MREAPCTLEGKECRAVACGADEAFRRDCFCLTNWTWTSCDNPFPTRPGVDIPLCPDDVVDGGECVTDRSVCGPLDNGEYCVCYAGDAGVALVWDCEAPPDPWPE
jgi:hypothetical protein